LMDSVADAAPDRLADTRARQDDEKDPSVPDQLPLWRLNLLRAGYAILGIGLAIVEWPGIIHHDKPWALMEGVVSCMLGALSILALLGLRYPLKMLPILLFESAWKLIWLAVVALPLWTAQQMDPATQEVTYSCLWVIIIIAVIPWRHVCTHYAAGGRPRC
jgi:hypothetical protein